MGWRVGLYGGSWLLSSPRMSKSPQPDSNPTVFLGKDVSSDGIREAAVQIWRAIYRDRCGHDPTPEFEAEVLRLHQERETRG